MTTRKKILLAGHYFLLFMGLLALGLCASVAVEANRYQVWAREQLRKSKSEAIAPMPSGAPGALPPQHSITRNGNRLVGKVDVPRIHLSAMITDGTNDRALRLAVGHVTGTALPGDGGNVALAAHRDTFFRRLGELESGDLIRITTPGGAYAYRVIFTDIVRPDETWVLQPATGETLTLITCYPFHFVGAAPRRFVVRARRVNLDQVLTD